MATDNAEFKPYIPANKITTELTVTSIITGIILRASALYISTDFFKAIFAFITKHLFS